MQQTQSPKRVACVDVPALALQLVLRAHPEWAQDPVVIVTDDRPRAPIVWANRAARAVGIDPYRTKLAATVAKETAKCRDSDIDGSAVGACPNAGRRVTPAGTASSSCARPSPTSASRPRSGEARQNPHSLPRGCARCP